MPLLTAAVVCLVLGFASSGWGRLYERYVGSTGVRGPALCAVGLVVLLGAGGLLNLVGLCSWPALLVLAATGMFGWLPRSTCSDPGDRGDRVRWVRVLPYLGAILVGVYALATLAGPSVYNWHDDMEKYLRHPLRMLSTGTLRSAPFDALGVETLGGMAFLHGFAAAVGGPLSVNVIDSVFGLFLVIAMTASIARAHGAGIWTANLVALCVFLPDPAYVNVGSIYTGAVLMLLLLELAVNANGRGQASKAMLAGGAMAGLVALKSTFVPFTVIYCLLLALEEVLRTRSWPRSMAITVAAATLLSAPWIALHWGTAYSMESLAAGIGGGDALLGFQNPFGGEMAKHYPAQQPHAYAVLVGFFFAAVWIGRERGPALWSDLIARWAAPGVVLLCYLLYTVVFPAHALNPDQALRYAVPCVIAAVAATGPLFASAVKAVSARRSVVWLVCFVGAIFALFGASAWRRVQSMALHHVAYGIEDFADHPAVVGYNQLVRQPDTADMVLAIQSRVPPGAKVACWTQMSFLLSDDAITLIDVVPAGLRSPQGEADVGRAGSYLEALRRDGVQYFLFQHRHGIRSVEGFERTAQLSRGRERAICSEAVRLLGELDEAMRQPQAVVAETEWLILLRI